MNLNPKIFISYRRLDSAGSSGRLYDHLSAKFQEENVFKDVNKIPVGENFWNVIENEINKSDIFILVIGRHFFDIADINGHKKIYKTEDVVSTEVSIALRLKKIVIPVLVDGATMLDEEELPNALKQLSSINGFNLSHEKWKSDMILLIEKIEDKIYALEKELIERTKQEKLNLAKPEITVPTIPFIESTQLMNPANTYRSSSNSFSAFYISKDGKYLIIGNNTGRVEIIDIQNIKYIKMIKNFNLESGKINSIDITNDNKHIVLGKDKKGFWDSSTVSLLNLSDGNEIKKFNVKRDIENVSFSKNDKLLSVSCRSHSSGLFGVKGLILFEVDSGKELFSEFIQDSVVKTKFSIDNKYFIYAINEWEGGDGGAQWCTLNYLDLSTLKIKKPNYHFAGSCLERNLVDISNNGKHILYKINNAIALGRLDIEKDYSTNYQSNKSFLSPIGANFFKTYDDKIKREAAEAYAFRVIKVIFSPDNTLAASLAYNNEIFIFETATGKTLKRFSFVNKSYIDIMITKDNNYLVTLSTSAIYFWSI